MSTRVLKLDFGQVDFTKLETEDFRREAMRLLPTLLRKIGEAEVMWKSMQKAFRGPGIKASKSPSDKRMFITGAGKEYAQKASSHEKRKLEDQIVESLREEKSKQS